jgi:hypothetical protein
MRQLSGASHFSNDLGLDSLDTVEVVMAIEEVGDTYIRKRSHSDGSTGVQHRDPRQGGRCHPQR